MGHHYQEVPGIDPPDESKKKPPPKLYVWEGVLTDYTAGVVFAYARSKRAALALIKTEDWGAWNQIKDLQHRLIRGPEAFVVWGGG